MENPEYQFLNETRRRLVHRPSEQKDYTGNISEYLLDIGTYKDNNQNTAHVLLCHAISADIQRILIKQQYG